MMTNGITEASHNPGGATPRGAADQVLTNMEAGTEERAAERPQPAPLSSNLLVRNRKILPSGDKPQFVSIKSDRLARKGDAQPWSSKETQGAETGAAETGATNPAAVETAKASDAQQQDRAAKAIAELTARAQAAEDALASARAERSRSEAERTEIRDQLERLRRQRDDEIAATNLATAESRKAEARHQETAARSIAELTARAQAAEEALASAAAERSRSEAEQADLREQLERLRRHQKDEIAAMTVAAAETAKAAEAQQQERTTKSIAELTARAQAAEDALASAHAEQSRAEAERAELRAQLEQLHRQREDTSATSIAAAETAKAAEAQRDTAARSIAELMARCHAAEDAVAAGQAERSRLEAERAEFRDQLERLQRQREQEIATLNHAAAERLKAAEVQQQERAAKSIAELAARAQAAEAALAAAETAARAADTGETDYGSVHSLNHKILLLQRDLTDREGQLNQALKELDVLRLKAEALSHSSFGRPVSSQTAETEAEEPQKANHLWREALIVFIAVVGLALLWPWAKEGLIAAGVLDAPAQERVAVAAAPAEPKLPIATVQRRVNLRVDHAAGADVLAILKSGAQVTILGQSGKWSEVQIPGPDKKILRGWVYASYLDAGAADLRR